MSKRRFTWTPRAIERAKKILSKHEQLADALHEMSGVFKFPIKRNMVDMAFRRVGKKTPAEFLKAIEYVHPVEKQESKEQKSREKQVIEQLTKELRVANERVEFLDALQKFEHTPCIMPEAQTKLRELVAVVLASDWHVEEPVDPASVAYRNEYNLAIAAKRIKKFFEAIVWNIKHHRADGTLLIKKLLLWLGGDLMTGYIHPELVENNQLSPSETILWLIPFISDGIQTLLELGLDLLIPCSYGNHGRTTDKPRIATGYANSYEWLMYHHIAATFKNEPRVKFEITPSAHQYVEVLGHTVHFHHGDDVKYQGGVGGLSIPLLKAVPMWDLIKKADVHCVGHHHTLLDLGRVVVNGSLIGYSPYSQRIKAAYEDPQQLMFFIDKKHGKCMPTALWVK